MYKDLEHSKAEERVFHRENDLHWMLELRFQQQQEIQLSNLTGGFTK